MTRVANVHWRVPYYRAEIQGGDTQSPLCEAPLAGYASDEAAAYAMTDKPGAVTCPWCSDWLAKGGLPARRKWLVERFYYEESAA